MLVVNVNSKAALAEIKRISQEIEAVTNKTLLVGFPKDETTSSGESLVQIAAKHEFGAGGMAQRAFLRPGVEKSRDRIAKAIEMGLLNSDDVADGLEQGLDAAGVVAVAGVQEFITELKSPENSAATIAKKGSSNPLIDTGNMRQSVSYIVSDEKTEEGL